MPTTGAHGIIIPDPSTANATVNQVRDLAIQTEAGLADVEATVVAAIDLDSYATKTYVDAALSGIDTSGSLIPLTGNVTIPAGTEQGELVGYRNFGTTTRTVNGETVPPGEYAIFTWTGSVWERIDAGADPYLIAATPPTFTDATGTANDRYTVPSVTGVEYRVNGTATSAGVKTPTAGQTVTITAHAVAPYTLKGVTSWSHTFSTATEPIPTGPVGVTHLGTGIHAPGGGATFTSHTFPGLPLGGPTTHRLIVAAVSCIAVSTRSLSSVTIGGVTATTVATGSGSTSILFAYAVVPAGTSADVAVTFTGAASAAVVELFEVVNTKKTHTGTLTTVSAKTATIPATTAGGVAMAVAYRRDQQAASQVTNWTGATELVDHSVPTDDHPAVSSAAWATTTGETQTVTVDISGLTPTVAAITFEKAV